MGNLLATAANVALNPALLAVCERRQPQSFSRRSIAKVVFEELARVQAMRSPLDPVSIRLLPSSLLAEAGIKDTVFMDAVSRIEGRYQMRFRDEWLLDMQTCEDLIACIADHMFDTVLALRALDAPITGHPKATCLTRY